MLPSENRLTAKKDFERVKKGVKYQSRLFGLLVRRTEGVATRFGFILSTKISKRATQRNRARRLLRESVRLLLKTIKPGFDVAFLGKKEILGKSLVEIQIEVETILKKAEVIVDEKTN